MRDRSIPEATVGRLPRYLQALGGMAAQGTVMASSEELALAAGVTSAKVRKDLSHLGSYGTRGVGYDVAYLIHQIRRELGLTQDWGIAIAGIGNLGHALANYKGFADRGFRVAGLVDVDPAKIGRTSRTGIPVLPYSDVKRIVAEHRVEIGIIAVTADSAQDVYETFVAAGLNAILNFAPVQLRTHGHVKLKSVDLRINLELLSFFLKGIEDGTA